MASFKDKIVGKGWEREKITSIVSFRPHPTRNRKFQKNSKTIEKIKKIPLWLYFNPISVGKSWDREKIKIIVPFRTYQTHNWKFQKNSKQIQKIKKFLFGFISSQNRLEKAEKERK